MKKYVLKTLTVFLIVIVFIPNAHIPAGASAKELPAVTVAISDDSSIIVERIMYEALRRSGYQMVISMTGMRTAIADVNQGDAAVLPLQIEGWDKRYENLIKVPVALDYMESTTYTLYDSPYEFSDWSDLEGLRLGYRWQNQYIAEQVHLAGAAELFEANTSAELWEKLLSGKVDVIAIPRLAHYHKLYPKGVRTAGIISRQPVYTYVNKEVYTFLMSRKILCH